MAKGTVKVEEFRGKLRLRWTVGGKTHCIGLRLDDSVINRRIAESKATAIQLDILSGNFDESLQKYKPKIYKSEKSQKVKILTFQELWAEYMIEREKNLGIRTIQDKFKSIQTRINEFGRDVKTQKDAEDFKDYLSRFNQPRQVLDKITDISACYKWGISLGCAQMNWFDRIKDQIQVEPKQQSKPFTTEEIRIILDGFQYPKYSHYFDYAQFLFLTGCRTSEAIGLRWKHIDKDFRSIWFGETITRGVAKSTKNNKARTFPCNEQLQKLLRSRFESLYDLSLSQAEESLVFTSPDGKVIDDRNFSKRVWKPLLEEMGIEYRRQYNTRHTFISHMLASGMEPIKIASITGHDVKVLYERYAGVISRIEVPEISLT